MKTRRIFQKARRLGVAGALLASLGCQPTVSQAAGTAQAATKDPSSVLAANTPPPFPTPPVLAGTPDIATLVARVKPAVVNITTEHEIKQPRMSFDFPFDFFPGFPGFRGPNNGFRGEERTLRRHALGSGFIVDPRGYVVTNAHVVEGAQSVKVKLADEREFSAKVKGRDERLDLAVLELENAKDLPVVSLGSSEALRVGEYVVAIGNPFGLGDTVTLGIVSAKSRTIGAGPYDDFIQTDASINPGNSGGPLFDLHGAVVGINTAINPAGQGIGFAIPVDALKEVLPQLLTTGHVSRGRLGVSIQNVDASLAKALGLDGPKGALVGEVEPGSPAAKAGLRSGDVIIGVNDTPVAHAQELPRLIARHAPGTRVTLTIRREKATQKVEATLDELKDEKEETDKTSGGQKTPQFGVELGDGKGDGAVVQRVIPGSSAEESLRPGDVIVEVNRKPVSRASDAMRELQATPQGQPALIKIMRQGHSRYVAIERR